MGTSSEDVLLSVNHIRYNKKDGTLYFMAERLGWIMNGKDAFSVSHSYSEIKNQKISPEGKSKIQLQVVLYSSGASTFHFINPLGEQDQKKDRNDVKELLQQLLPKFRSKITKELEEKNRILQEDQHLLNLYQNLVISQVITPDEFWANHANHKISENKINNASQAVGVSASFLSDVKPQSDGCNGLKYNLTADVIHSIFRTYPSVKRKHMENVPDKMSESEFWTLFFQSHYFHRDRFNAGLKDIFSECAKSDDQEIKTELSEGIQNPLVDINSFIDVVLAEGYGLASNSGTAKPMPSSTNNLSMIRRFNHHSMKILKVCESQKSSTDSNISSDKKEQGSMVPNGKEVNNHDNKSNEPDPKRLKLLEKLEYEDLEKQTEHKITPLNLQKLERYLHGPVPVTNQSYVSSDEMLGTLNFLHKDLTPWKSDLNSVLNGATAVSVLGELSPGGQLMKGSQPIQLNDAVPQHIQSELKSLYAALIELLRHFWSCFPPTSSFLEEKIFRVHGSIERFQHAKLQPFRDQLYRQSMNMNLIMHIEQMILAANTKFQMWQSKVKRK